MAGTAVSGGGQGRQCCRAFQDIRPCMTKIPPTENKLKFWLKGKKIFSNVIDQIRQNFLF